ncbi:MAG: hypothetical protein ACW98U_06595 [Candidatus Thorarchaeota archaeon]|jgi:hypothetical protein
MDIDTELILDILADDKAQAFSLFLENTLLNQVESDKDWQELVNILRIAFSKMYQKHWLKIHQVLFSVFDIPELLGVDCDIFEELRAIPQPVNIKQVSNSLFEVLVEIAKSQLRSGGSTLFFNIGKISSTRTAIITSDLIEARYRETVLVLNEIDKIIPTLTKEWVNVSRLWRTGNGFRLMKATELGVVIHIKEYQGIRDLLLKELDIDSDKMVTAIRHYPETEYLQLSETLDQFVTGLVASRGIRGEYEPHFKTWIDHEGLDEF